jgi:FMN-dependent NADH-azoreductase
MTRNILYIESSIFGAEGASSQLAAHLLEQLRQQPGEVSVTERHLHSNTIPHFDTDTIGAISTGESVLADTLIAEVQAADTLIIGAPMYNFGVPTQLKAWFDHIARAGVTFHYTENGPQGMLTGKKAYVLTSRGGIHKDAVTDVQVPFLRNILGFLGISDVSFIYAEGLNLGGDSHEQGMAAAREQIAQLLQRKAA